MEAMEGEIFRLKNKLLNIYPSFGSEMAITDFVYTTEIKTACTDGKIIYINPNFLNSLPERQKLGILGHEFLHQMFLHIPRMIDKDGNRRDSKVWNIATDAIINANLLRDGMELPEGCVKIPNATKFTAEELYEILLKRKEKLQQNQQGKSGKSQKGKSSGQEQGGSSQGNDDDSNEQKDKYDFDVENHDMWEDALDKMLADESNNEEEAPNQGNSDTNDNPLKNMPEINEKDAFEKNRELRKEIRNQQKAQAEAQSAHEAEAQKNAFSSESVGNVGVPKKAAVDWKRILTGMIGSKIGWSDRRARKATNYSPRLMDIPDDEEKVTEVMIDASGSVDYAMVREFLRQLKPLVRETKLKVGYFADSATDKLKEIKTAADVDKFPEANRNVIGWGTNSDAAVGAFSKDKETNKIVFTDGGMDSPDDKYRSLNVIWVVYEDHKHPNNYFKPCCGKIIKVNANEFRKGLSLKNDDSMSR